MTIRGNARDLFHEGSEGERDVDRIVRRDGISDRVMKTGQVEIIEDVDAAKDRVNKAMFDKEVGAALCLPFAVHGERIGVMWIHYGQPQRFQSYQIDALQLFANQCAAAYESARKIEALEHLHEAAKALSGADQVDVVLQQIVKSARRVAGAQSAAIWSYDDMRNIFVTEESVSAGIPEEIWDQQFRKRSPRLSRTAFTVMEQGWIGVDDVTDRGEYPFLGDTTRGLLHEIDVKSFQGVALAVGKENLGVLYVNYGRSQSFTEGERRTTQTFADLAALALKKTRLLRRVRNAQNTARIVAKMTVRQNLEATLAAVVKGTKEALDCGAVTLYVYDLNRNKLRYPPTQDGVSAPDQLKLVEGIPKDSIVFKMLQRDRIYVVENAAKDEFFGSTRFRQEEEIESCVAIPLIVGGKKVGIMFVNYRSQHKFSDEDRTELELFANQAAVAIHDAQLYEKEQRQAGTLKALNEAGRAVTSSLDLKRTLDQLAKWASRIAGDRKRTNSLTCIRLVDDGRMRLVAAYSPEQDDEIYESIGADIHLKETEGRIGIVGRVAISGKSLCAGEVQNHPDYLERDPRIHSNLAVPVRINEQVIGVINAENPEREAFDLQDQRALEAFATHAAIAIENARYAEALQTIQTTSAAVSVVEDIKETLDLIVDKAVEVFGAPATSVMLWDDSRNNLIIRAASGLGREYVDGRVISRNVVDRLARRDALRPQVFCIQDEALGDAGLVRQEGLCGALVAPLTDADGDLVGTLNIYSKTADHQFTEYNVKLAEILANHASIAIQNARRFQMRKELLRVGETVVSEENLFSALQIIVDGIKLTTNCDLVSLYAYDPDTKEITYPVVLAGELLHPDKLPDWQHASERRMLNANALMETSVIRGLLREGRSQFSSVSRDNLVLGRGDFVKREGIESSAGILLKHGGEIVGFLFLNYRNGRAFLAEQKQAIGLFASQAAMTINSARRYQQMSEYLHELRTLHEITTLLAGMLELDSLLDQVIKSAMKLTATSSGSILFWDSDDKRFVGALATNGLSRDLEAYETTARSQDGFARKIIEARKPLAIHDTHMELNINPNAIKKGRRAFIGAPLISGIDVIGVLYVNSTVPRWFTDAQIRLLEAFGNTAAIAIQRANQYEELKHTKGLVGARTALAWMGMANNAWRHSIEGCAINIRNAATLLTNEVPAESPSREKLNRIERLATEILEKPITPPLSSEEGVGIVMVNELVSERTRQLWESDEYQGVKPFLQLNDNVDTSVLISPEWLRRAFDLLVDNAVRAAIQSTPPEIMIATRRVDRFIEIEIGDTGSGVSPDIIPKLFREQIEHSQDERGMGMGLLMVQAIVQTYGGDIRLEDTGPNGTTMVVSLPAASV